MSKTISVGTRICIRNQFRGVFSGVVRSLYWHCFGFAGILETDEPDRFGDHRRAFDSCVDKVEVLEL